jgi:hypothetical protein
MFEKLPQQHQPAQPQHEALGKGQNPPAFQLKADETVQKKDKIEKTYDSHNLGDAELTIPKGATGSMPVVVVYGGLVDRGGTYKNIIKTMPQSYLSTHIFIFAEHYVGFAGLKKGAAKVFKEKGIEPTYKALCGFSKGGETLVGAMKSESWGLLGMMDPSVSGTFKDYSANVYMVWNHWGAANKSGFKKNMDKYNKPIQDQWLREDQARKDEAKTTGIDTPIRQRPEIVDDPETVDPDNADNRAKLHKMIKGGLVAGDSEHMSIGHLDMPAAWFNKYGGML